MSEGQRPWVTPNSEKIDLLTEAINKKHAQERADSRDKAYKTPAHDMSTNKGQFNAVTDPKSSKRADNEAKRAKSSVEAETIRKTISPEFRADPYPPIDSQSANTNKESMTDKVKSGFKAATSAFRDKWSRLR